LPDLLRSKTARPAAGFTLLEILVVVAIISILAIYLVGGEGRMRRNVLINNTMSEISGLMYSAKNMAITNNAVYEVTFIPKTLVEYTSGEKHLEPCRMSVEKVGSTDRLEAATIDNALALTCNQPLVGTGLKFKEPNDPGPAIDSLTEITAFSFQFNPDGSTNHAGVVTYTLTEGKSVRTVEVSLAGMVKVKTVVP
jgi:prepilin-type N-terminal cleavage/methylation domain-containing protein